MSVGSDGKGVKGVAHIHLCRHVLVFCQLSAACHPKHINALYALHPLSVLSPTASNYSVYKLGLVIVAG